jgi:hypothetical protein
MLSLTAIAIVTGVALAWIWKRLADRERMALAKRQARAQIYAMRLYADDPALVFRAQGRLLVWTARYLAGMWRPTAAAVIPLFILFPKLDNVYGHRPPAEGESVVVTARFDGGEVPSPEGRGVVVETPGVRLPGGREVCWRVRVDHRLKPVPPAKAFRCGHAFWRGSPSIEMACPAANLDVFGFGIDWEVWFLVVSGITMLTMKRQRVLEDPTQTWRSAPPVTFALLCSILY